MKRIIAICTRLLCYTPLVFIAVAYGAQTALAVSETCNSAIFANPQCTTQFAHDLAEWSVSIILLTIVTGLPLLLAACGALFAIHDVWKMAKTRFQTNRAPA